MPGLDEVLARLSEDYGVPDEELEPLKGSALRKKLEDAEARAAKAEQLERELSQVRKAPIARKALEDFGVQFDQLRPGELKRVEGFSFEGDAPTTEEVASFVQTEGFPVRNRQPQPTDTPADQIAQFASGQAGAPPQSAQVDYSKAKNMSELLDMHRRAHEQEFRQ